MIKTLRITSIIAAIVATVLLVLPAVYGVRSDSKIEEFIKSPGAVDKFTAAKGQNPAQKTAETSPLIKQAADFGLFLNPPPPPPPKVQPGAALQGSAPPAPPVVAVKFDLVATSYYASHPEQSFVLINEPGKGLHWVKQGSDVGHLIIETVKDGAIIVRDGQRTSEMTVKVQEPWRKLLKNPPPETQPSSSPAPPASPVAQAPTPPAQPSPVTTDKPNAASLPTRHSPIQGAIPPAAERITPATQPAQAATQPPPAAEITPPPQETPPPEDSPAVKEKTAKIADIISEMKSSSDKGKTDELFKQLDELSKIKAVENAKDANK